MYEIVFIGTGKRENVWEFGWDQDNCRNKVVSIKWGLTVHLSHVFILETIPLHPMKELSKKSNLVKKNQTYNKEGKSNITMCVLSQRMCEIKLCPMKIIFK